VLSALGFQCNEKITQVFLLW